MLAIVVVVVGLLAVIWAAWVTVRLRQMGAEVSEIARGIREGDARAAAAREKATQAVRVAREKRAAAGAALK